VNLPNRGDAGSERGKLLSYCIFSLKIASPFESMINSIIEALGKKIEYPFNTNKDAILYLTQAGQWATHTNPFPFY